MEPCLCGANCYFLINNNKRIEDNEMIRWISDSKAKSLDFMKSKIYCCMLQSLSELPIRSMKYRSRSGAYNVKESGVDGNDSLEDNASSDLQLNNNVSNNSICPNDDD